MKLLIRHQCVHLPGVTLYVRVWIETRHKKKVMKKAKVTLYVRVWIETAGEFKSSGTNMVTLYVRVWIETTKLLLI